MASKQEKREMIIKRDDTTFDRILANHKNPDAFPLTKNEQEQLDRWEEAFTLMLNHWSKPKIVQRLIKEHGIRSSQAYADIRNAEMLFGNVLKADAEGYRAKWLLWAEDYLMRCKQKNDRSNEAKALLLIGKYAQLDKEEDPRFNPAKLENPDILFDLDKTDLAALKQHTNTGKGGVDDLNLTGPIEYVEFEELDDNGDS